MTEVLLTSSALILALLLLRQLFRHSISQRLQYGLWGLVLLRLLLPAALLPQGDFGLLAGAEPAVRQAESQVLYLQPYREEIWSPMEISPLARTSRSKDAALGPASSDGTYTYTDQNGVSHRTEYRRQIALADLLDRKSVV